MVYLHDMSPPMITPGYNPPKLHNLKRPDFPHRKKDYAKPGRSKSSNMSLSFHSPALCVSFSSGVGLGMLVGEEGLEGFELEGDCLQRC
jgi:hypothetical protein